MPSIDLYATDDELFQMFSSYQHTVRNFPNITFSTTVDVDNPDFFTVLIEADTNDSLLNFVHTWSNVKEGNQPDSQDTVKTVGGMPMRKVRIKKLATEDLPEPDELPADELEPIEELPVLVQHEPIPDGGSVEYEQG